MTKNKEEKQYNGWLVSPNFFKRSFAVMGHYLFASLLVSIILFMVMFVWVIGFSLLVASSMH